MQHKKYLWIVSFLVNCSLFSLSALYVNSANIGKAPHNFADIVQPLLPSVVNISTTTQVKQGKSAQALKNGRNLPLNDLLREFLQGMQPGNRKSHYLGSGFIIKQEQGYAYVVTANHVISNADKIKITLNDDQDYEAIVVGHDKRTDIALLKFKISKKVSAVDWGDSSKVRVGEWIIAVGNPFGLSSTVTVGIVSTISRDIGARANMGGADYVNGYIQTDAPINMGNSGGPMFDVNGKVQAVSTAIISPNGGSIGIGFGVPANLAKQVVEQLFKYGRTKRGWIGVSIQPISPEIAESLGLEKPEGALIANTTKDGPAEKANIKKKDIITHFNGKKVIESKQLQHIVGNTEINTKVPLTVWRNGKFLTLHIVVGEFEKAIADGLIDSENAENQPDSNKSEDVLGIVTKVLSKSIRAKYGIVNNPQGLFIADVDVNSEAYEKIIRPHSIIEQISVGDKSIVPKTPGEFKEFVAKAKKSGKKQILFLINIKGMSRYVALSIDKKIK